MITSRQRILWAGLLASATFAVSAQTPPSPVASPAAHAAAAEHRQHKAHDGKAAERFQERRAKKLDTLKTQLKLDPSQQGAWNSFTASTQMPMRSAQQRPDRAEFEKMTTPQRLDRMQAHQAERAAAFAKRSEATRTFYAALTSEQQKTFDAQTLHRGAHRGHARHGKQGHGEHPAHQGPRPSSEKPAAS